jgi:hypothetical protein
MGGAGGWAGGQGWCVELVDGNDGCGWFVGLVGGAGGWAGGWADGRIWWKGWLAGLECRSGRRD